MRLFIAVQLSKEMISYLSSMQKSFRPLISGVFTNEFHLTLKFLGEVSQEKAAETVNRLKEVSFNRFDAELTHIGTFPNNKKHARVLWVGLSPEEIITHLHLAVEKELKGLFDKDFNFNPHITIARVKGVKNKAAFEKLTSSPVKNLKVNINRFCLMKSELSKDGAVHTVLNEFDLN